MLGTIADVVTFLAFFVTCVTTYYVFFIDRKVKYISNLFALLQSLPKQLARLEKKSSILKEYYSVTDEDRFQLQDIVANICAICHNIEKKIKKQDKIKLLKLKEVIQMCDYFSKRNMTDEDIFCLHGDLMLLIYSIEEEKKDCQVKT